MPAPAPANEKVLRFIIPFSLSLVNAYREGEIDHLERGNLAGGNNRRNFAYGNTGFCRAIARC
jgi:hypothetical protein